VLHALPDSVMVVHPQQADSRPVRPHIHKHQRHMTVRQLVQQRLFNAEGHHCHAFGLALNHAANATLHPLWIIIGRADEDFISVLDGRVLESLNQFGEKRVGNLGDDEPEMCIRDSQSPRRMSAAT